MMKLPKLPKRAVYHIYGKIWFDAVNGNSYLSVVVLMNNEEIINVPFAYGYDQAYQQTAVSELRKIYNLPETGQQVFNAYGLQRHGYNIKATGIDVKRKKDL